MADTRFKPANDTRALIWSHLVIYPGLTASELRRSVLRGQRGDNVIGICRRMERDGQLFGSAQFRAQQGREVTCWYAVPGASPDRPRQHQALGRCWCSESHSAADAVNLNEETS